MERWTDRYGKVVLYGWTDRCGKVVLYGWTDGQTDMAKLLVSLITL
jgi:hypothetical protein